MPNTCSLILLQNSWFFTIIKITGNKYVLKNQEIQDMFNRNVNSMIYMVNSKITAASIPLVIWRIKYSIAICTNV